jgi:hypothetical protein
VPRSELLDRPVAYVELSEEQWLENVAAAGINEIAVEHLVHLWRYLRSGQPQQQDGFRVTDTIEQLGVSPPLTLRAYLWEHRDALATPPARPGEPARGAAPR